MNNVPFRPKKPPFTYTELIEYALEDKGELTVSGIYNWISWVFQFESWDIFAADYDSRQACFSCLKELWRDNCNEKYKKTSRNAKKMVKIIAKNGGRRKSNKEKETNIKSTKMICISDRKSDGWNKHGVIKNIEYHLHKSHEQLQRKNYSKLEYCL